MRILLIHNHYLHSGGEDFVFLSEEQLLLRYKNQINRIIENNHRIEDINKYKLAFDAIWSLETYQGIKYQISHFSTNVAHFHNIFPLISPSAYYACYRISTPIVQTLHNYRLICPSSLFLRYNRICESCKGKIFPWPAIKYRCYHNSRKQSAVVSAMLFIHRLLHTWNKVDVYIALSNFARQKFIEGGLPAHKIVVKPNFVSPDPLAGSKKEQDNQEKHILFAGRLSHEKGLFTLFAAFKLLKDIPLQVAGDGPLIIELQSFLLNNRIDNISLIGRQARAELFDLFINTFCVIVPSECYENFPMVIAESFACGTPVIASRLGAMAEIVEDGKTGLLFTPGDAEDLAAKVQWAWDHPKEMAEMGKNARREYEEKYTAERNYQMLMDIYQMAIENHKKRR